MRDKDIRQALRKIPNLNIFSVNVNQPTEQDHEGIYDMYNKIYHLDELTVFVEAQMGVKRVESSVGRVPNIVTFQEQRAYKKMRRKIMKKTKKELKQGKEIGPDDYKFSHKYVRGPIVDYPQDTGLDTMRVQSVLIQYEGLNLIIYQNERWDKLIDSITDKYNVKIGLYTDGIKEVRSVRFEKIDLDIKSKKYTIPTKSNLAFQRIIIKKKDLVSGIEAVLEAGNAFRKEISKVKYEPEGI